MAPLHKAYRFSDGRRDFGFGSKIICTVGDMRMVWNGTAKHTAGGLKKADLIKNKRGKIVSRKRHALGKKRWPNGPPGGKVFKRKSPKKRPRKKKSSRKSAKQGRSSRRRSGAFNKVSDKKGSWHLHKGHSRQKIVYRKKSGRAGKVKWMTRRSSGKHRGAFLSGVSPKRALKRDLATHAKKLNRGGDGGRADSRYVRKTNRAGRKGSVRKASR